MQSFNRISSFFAVAALFVVSGIRPATATVLLNGASAPSAQGWNATTISTPAATVTNNGTYTEVSTLGTTGGSGSTSGIMLFNKNVTLSTIPVYQLDISLQVLAGTAAHNQFDAGVAFGASSDSPIFWTSAERAQMIYFDTNGIGWGDNTGSFAMDTTTAFHTYSLQVNTATGAASVSVDGTLRLTRSGYFTSDEIGFGDQTNDQNVNGDFRVAGITLTPEPAALSLIAFAGFALLGRGRRVRAD